MLLSNPYICPKVCPKRSADCHNVETCEQYRKFRELNEEIKKKQREEKELNIGMKHDYYTRLRRVKKGTYEK